MSNGRVWVYARLRLSTVWVWSKNSVGWMMCSLWLRIQDITSHLMVTVESDDYQNQLKCVLVGS